METVEKDSNTNLGTVVVVVALRDIDSVASWDLLDEVTEEVFGRWEVFGRRWEVGFSELRWNAETPLVNPDNSETTLDSSPMTS